MDSWRMDIKNKTLKLSSNYKLSSPFHRTQDIPWFHGHLHNWYIFASVDSNWLCGCSSSICNHWTCLIVALKSILILNGGCHSETWGCIWFLCSFQWWEPIMPNRLWFSPESPKASPVSFPIVVTDITTSSQKK